MTTITRFNQLQRLTRSIISQRILYRSVNTSSKNTSQENVINTVRPETPLIPVNSNAPTGRSKKNWISYGFCDEHYEGDRHIMHQTLFVTISIVVVGCGYVLSFRPDYKLEDWSHREAYLVLREREALGLPPIDRNLIDPAKIKLPTDEELGDTEIII